MDKLLQEFLEFEKDEQLFKRKYLGVEYWQSSRLSISRNLQERESKVSQYPAMQEKRFLSVLKRIKGIYFDVINWISLGTCDILYFDKQAYRNIDGVEVDSYFDYWKFQDSYSIKRCYYCSGIDTKGFRGKGIGVTLPDFAHDVAAVFHQFFNKTRDKKEDKEIIRICNRLNDKFNSSILFEKVVNRISDYVIIEKVYHKFYYRLIKKLRPKAIFVVCHYSETLFPLYNVAKQCNIPVIELQHGLTCFHDAYNYEDVSVAGKSLPDYFFSYGEFWGKYVNLPRNMKTIVVGNPYLENQKQKYANVLPDENAIVFYSDEITGKKLAEFAVKFVEKNINKGYKIYFKFHPSEKNYAKEYLMLIDNSKICLLPLNTGVYEVLAMAKHHVTVMSTVLYEATIYDVERYVWKLEGMSHYLQPLVDIEVAKSFETLDEFEALLLVDSKNNHEISKEMWADNATERGQNALKEILDGKNHLI